MKRLGFALIAAVSLFAVPATNAAPIAAAPIAQAAGTANGIEHVWYDRWGVWHPNRPFVRAPIYIAPPVVVVPVCRRVWVCGPRGRCWWERRCY